jgi:hypothetical protein
MTILEEACHSLIIVEHDPMLYRGFNRDGRVHLAGVEARGARGHSTAGINPFLEEDLLCVL